MWEKYCTAVQATYGNMAHAHFMLDAYSYKHSLRICNTDYFSTTTVVSRKHLNVTHTYIACLVHHILSEQQHRDVFWAKRRVI